MSWTDVERSGGTGEKTKLNYTKFGEGNTLIRILDSEPYSFWNHWMMKQQKGVTCLGKGCPICSVIANQKANKETPTYSSTQRHAVRIYNYTTKQMEIMIQGKQFFEQLLNLHREVGDIQTYDIKVTRKGSDTSTTYMLLPTNPKAFEHTDQMEDVNFEELFRPIDKEKLLELMEGKSWEEVFAKTDEAA